MLIEKNDESVPFFRRVGLIVYEALLAVAIAFFVTFCMMWPIHVLHWRSPLPTQLALGLTLLVYFSWGWSHTRQTLPMKTWGVRLYTLDDGSVSYLQAAFRFIVYWAPLALLALFYAVMEWRGYQVSTSSMRWSSMISALLFPWLTGVVHPQHLFLHDALSRTRLCRVQNE
jgi:uncharacterized RDD family membrane protein YckC